MKVKHCFASEKIKLIDKNLEEIDLKIDKSVKIVEQLKDKIERTKKEFDDNIFGKQCAYDRSRYCREKDESMFFHAQEICKIYLRNQKCWKANCRQRHPKPCRYFW